MKKLILPAISMMIALVLATAIIFIANTAFAILPSPYVYHGVINGEPYDAYFADESYTVWALTILFYDANKTKMHALWRKDYNPGYGDITYSEYDSLGRLIKTVYDTGEQVITDYNDSSTTKWHDIFINVDGSWHDTVEYDSTGARKVREWVEDLHPDPGDNNDIVYIEYDALGRIAREKYDEYARWNITEYWDDTDPNSNKKYTIMTDLSGHWNKTVEYYDSPDSPPKIHKMWKVCGEIPQASDIYTEYDGLGRETYIVRGTGEVIMLEYWDFVSTCRKYEIHMDARGSWKETFQYFDDGLNIQYHWMADTNSANKGDTVYEEKTRAGRTITKVLDEGTTLIYSDDEANRLCKEALPAVDVDGVSYYTYHYFASSGRLQSKRGHDSDDNNIVTYIYNDDEFNRLSQKHATEGGQSVAYYYNNDEFNRKKRRIGGGYTVDYYNNENNGMKKREGYDENSIMSEWYYYDDATNYCQAKWMMTYADDNFYHYFHYLNDGTGRADVIARTSADADGAKVYKILEYYTGTSVVKKKACYRTAQYDLSDADKLNPTFDPRYLICTYEYTPLGYTKTGPGGLPFRDGFSDGHDLTQMLSVNSIMANNLAKYNAVGVTVSGELVSGSSNTLETGLQIK